MLDRRTFISRLAAPVAAATAATLDVRRALAEAEELFDHRGTAADTASDEDFWRPIQRAFSVDRSLINLNNGGVSPSPSFVQQAMGRHLAQSHQAPSYTMWQILEPRLETVRARLASAFGCDPEEMAVTRNASEGLQICQFGFDLEPGDEVIASDQDYPRMLTTFEQRQRREGIVLRRFPLPVPAEDPAEVVRRYEAQVTPRTRLALVCHMINLTGQILPVREIVAAMRRRGIPTIVDGAHAFAHFPFGRDDLDCDYYATSLHKWLFAPHGTGFLYVRRDKIADLWPLQAAPERLDGDIRKFEEIGTHPAANHLAIAEALTFNEGIGAERKLARLVFLRDRWARRLLEHDRVRLHTSLEPGFAAGIATVEIEGIEPGALHTHLWEKHRIIVTPIVHPNFRGLRISPSVYTTREEIDRFADAMEGVLARDGKPSKANVI